LGWKAQAAGSLVEATRVVLSELIDHPTSLKINWLGLKGQSKRPHSIQATPNVIDLVRGESMLSLCKENFHML
jgi:hypothetical protein